MVTPPTPDPCPLPPAPCPAGLYLVLIRKSSSSFSLSRPRPFLFPPWINSNPQSWRRGCRADSGPGGEWGRAGGEPSRGSREERPEAGGRPAPYPQVVPEVSGLPGGSGLGLWGTGSGRLAGKRVCNHFLTGLTGGVTGRTHLSL